jgi:DNA invertase Pin-like site-specific DNA recombinase
VKRLAEADGHNGNLVEYSDWGVSADIAKAAKRTDYVRLLADMESGKVSAVYAFDVDRLYRDPRDLIRLQDAALSHGVQITTTSGSLPIGETDDPLQEGFAFIQAVFGRMELQKAKKRARAAREARMARGDQFGHPVWGTKHMRQTDDGRLVPIVKGAKGRIVAVPDPALEDRVRQVMDVVRSEGTILGAVKALNERGIPSPKGKTWHGSQLTRVVEYHAPDLLRRHRPGGRPAGKVNGPALLTKVVRCHCGQMMTPNQKRGQLYCYQGNRLGVAVHGRAHVREQDVLPYVVAKASEYTHNTDATVQRANLSDRQTALEAERERVAEARIDGLITREAARERVSKIDAELSQIADALAQLGPSDFDPRVDASEIDPAVYDLYNSPEYSEWRADANASLRRAIRWVQLDEDMKPVGVEYVGS